MALKQAFHDAGTGVTHPNAYHRVAGVILAFDDDSPAGEITLAVYVDEAARKSGKGPFMTRAIAVPNAKAGKSEIGEKDSFKKRLSDDALGKGVTPVQACYAYLKSPHPLYKGAKDV